MQIKSLSREKIKVSVWIGVLALVALVIAQLFQSINADQIVSPATFGPPQYPNDRPTAIDGVAVLDVTTMTTDSKGVNTYDCDDKGIGATIALYTADGSAPKKTTTDDDCSFFDYVAMDLDDETQDYTLCAFAKGLTPPKTPSEIVPPDARFKCRDATLDRYTDNYIDLNLITPVAGLEYGVLNVLTKDTRGNNAMGMTVAVSCTTQKDIPNQVTNSDGKATFVIMPPGQSCDIKVRDYTNVEKTARATVNKFPPETNVTVTVANTTPGITFIKSLFGIQKAHAAPGKKTRVLPRLKNNEGPAKKVTQAQILGSLSNEKGQAVAGVKVKLTRIKPDVITVNDFGQEVRLSPQIATTNAQGQFTFSAIKFTVNVDNEYKIEIENPAFEVAPREVKIWGTPAATGTIVLNKDMKGGNPQTSANIVTPYKQGGVQIVAQSKGLPSLKGQTAPFDASTNLTPTELMGKFTVKEEDKAPQVFDGTASFVYSNPKFATYIIQFEPTDPKKVEVEGYYDANNPTVQLTSVANSNAASVTLSEANKNASVLVKLKKITAVGLSGETLKIGTVPNDKGTFTVLPSNATFPKTNTFTYKFAKLGETYGVTFDPDDDGVEIDGYYEASDLTKPIDNTKIELTETKPIFKLIVKLKKASTSLDIKLTPPKEEIVTFSVDQKYEDSRPKLPEKLNVLDMRTKAGAAIRKIFKTVKTVKTKETVVHMSYRVPNAGVKVKLDNKPAGTTDENGIISIKDASEWAEEKPEVAAYELKIPACHHVHTQVTLGGVVKNGARVAYTRGSLALDAETPVLGKISGEKIKTGKNNEATINKSDFEPENFNPEFQEKAIPSDGDFFEHQEKLNRCINGKPLIAPVFKTATITPKDGDEVKLAPGASSTGTVTWEITEADGKPIDDKTITASLEIKASGEGGISVNKAIDFKGSETFPLTLNKNKGRDYDIIIRVKGTQSDNVEKKFELKTKKQ